MASEDELTKATQFTTGVYAEEPVDYDEGREVRLLGVTLRNLEEVKDRVKQLNIFEYQKEVDDDKVKKIINDINNKLGYEALKKAKDI